MPFQFKYYSVYIYIYIYIYVCVCVCVCVFVCVCVCVCKREREEGREKKWFESDRMYVEKVKREKNMFDGLFICQRVSISMFGWMQKYFIKIILAWEIVMIDTFLIQLEVFFRACRACYVKKRNNEIFLH